MHQNFSLANKQNFLIRSKTLKRMVLSVGILFVAVIFGAYSKHVPAGAPPPFQGDWKPLRSKRSTQCYEDLGCFSNAYPFNNTDNALPLNPRFIRTRFLLFTSINDRIPRILSRNDAPQLQRTRYDGNKPTKFVIHGFSQNGMVSWTSDLAKELMKKEPINVLVVDWGHGSGWPYTQAVANTRVVGKEIAKMIEFLVAQTNGDLSKFHLIGHSLGAHVAGYAGEALQGRIGRITGLDPAEPNYKGTDIRVRLDPSDAQFVDVIHTDGSPFDEISGYGLMDPLGDVDFYPNGGENQPGCAKESWVNIFSESYKHGILDLFLEIDTQGRLCTRLYDKRDDFNFPIVNFPFLCSNIPSAPAFGVYVSQLIRYSRACGEYNDFLDRAARLTSKLLTQGYVAPRLLSSLKKFYGRHHVLVYKYGISISQMSTDVETTDTIACSHSRSIHLFKESISSACPFRAFPCENFESFKQGRCLQCGASPCPSLGLMADEYEGTSATPRGKFYLVTDKSNPYCGYTYGVELHLSTGMSPSEGLIDLSFTDTNGQRINHTFYSAEYQGGQKYDDLILTHNKMEGHVSSVDIKFLENSKLWSWIWTGSVQIDMVVLTDPDKNNRINFCGNDIIVNTGSSITLSRGPISCRATGSVSLLG